MKLYALLGALTALMFMSCGHKGHADEPSTDQTTQSQAVPAGTDCADSGTQAKPTGKSAVITQTKPLDSDDSEENNNILIIDGDTVLNTEKAFDTTITKNGKKNHVVSVTGSGNVTNISSN